MTPLEREAGRSALLEGAGQKLPGHEKLWSPDRQEVWSKTGESAGCLRALACYTGSGFTSSISAARLTTGGSPF